MMLGMGGSTGKYLSKKERERRLNVHISNRKKKDEEEKDASLKSPKG